jgi:GH15 family glucan-1,4-alpha-glucosidase
MSEPDLPISDYALLSDCHSTALVSRGGSIDWACLRRFDRPSTFGRLLDQARGGYFSVRPGDGVRSTVRRYLPGTMVLETTHTTDSATVVVTDAFAMRKGGRASPRAELVRRVECRDGETAVDVEIVPRFDYGATTPWLRAHGPQRASAVGGDDALVIAASQPLTIDHDAGAVRATVAMTAGDRLDVTVVSQPAYALDVQVARAEEVGDRLTETIEWWRTWSRATTVDGPHAELLERAVLVLKALNCAPTGAIIAAPTTSLPEVAGGDANWDYRYCWLRDATLALEALADLGHVEVAHGFRRFLVRSTAGHGDEVQTMYGCYGERRIPELELDLAGWRDSRPVRVGNAAVGQYQLDVYGHILDAVHLWHRRHDDIDADEWRFLASVVDQAAVRWQEPDAGIWEQRGEPRHFVHSKAMAWVALDRGIALARSDGFDAPHLDRWVAARDALRAAVERQGVDPHRRNFTRAFGSRALDASLLKLPLVGFVDANDERMLATTAAIEAQLVDDGLVRRYTADEDDAGGDTVAGGDEGRFLLCSCWLVEVLALQGRRDDAAALFDRIAGLANDVGLLAEEYDPARGELLGNFPQAFTHLGLVVAEHRLRQHPSVEGAKTRPPTLG